MKFGQFKTKDGLVQRYRCQTCGKTSRDKRPLEGVTIPKEKAIQILNLLVEGVGIRACSRLTGCDTKTVLKVLVEAGIKCDQIHDELVRNIRAETLQLDELWGRVFCKEVFANKAEDRGDFYTFLALEPESKLIVSYYTGKRNRANARIFLEDTWSRIAGEVQTTTDAWKEYINELPLHLRRGDTYATMHKVYSCSPTGEGSRRYAAPIVTGVHIRNRIGKPDREKVGTSHVERCNLSARHFNRRLTRLTLGYSKKLGNHRLAVSLWAFAYNFCKINRTTEKTPAQAAGLTDKRWSIDEIFESIY